MKKKAIKALWKQCFTDSADFVDLYFDLRYNNEVNIALESGKDVIAALQLLPYPMTFCGKLIQTAYISGACTHPDYRNKGVMRELLSQAFGRMIQTKSLISTLIPAESWLYDYYAHAGYAAVFHYAQKELSAQKLPTTASVQVSHTNQYEEDIYQYLNKKMEERSCCIQHTETDFRVILADLARTQDSVYVAKQEGAIVGIAVGYKWEQAVYVKELLTESEEISNELLHQIGQISGQDQIKLTLPPTPADEAQRSGMARIIDAKSVLQLYAAAYPEQEMSIELVDEQLSANNGYYYVCNGKCMYSEERIPETHIRLNIGELSERILAPLQPYMSLMLD
ncbi:MAG: GNAT family N-acetyltransferase [Bacteroides sp.]|nr:GNAT family N-acetyltransferase [Bacteroides sp.]